MTVIDAPSDVAVIMSAGVEVERGLITLAAAESLTDEVAEYLLGLVSIGFAKELVSALHLTDFVIERNSEWNLAPKARQYLQSMLMERHELMQTTHAFLLQLARSSEVRSKFEEIPRYLTAGPGEAYHSAFLNVEEGLSQYSQVALRELSGQQWLATKLAREQQDLLVLPEDVLELDFLQGMVYYREGRTVEAIQLLRKVANAPVVRLETAIAAHLVGRYDGRRRRTPRSEQLLWRSLEINEALKNRRGEAQVLNTLGQLIGRDRRRTAEAEQLLRRSIEIGTASGDARQASVAMHTLGQLIGRKRRRTAEAEQWLRQSLAIEKVSDDRSGEAQVLNTLGQLIGRDRRRTAEAEQLLRRSIEIGTASGDARQASVAMHTLGQLIGRDLDRAAEAEDLLRQSLSMGETLGNKFHQAQVLYSLARVRSVFDRDEAVMLLERSLSLNQELRYQPGISIVRRALRRFAQ